MFDVVSLGEILIDFTPCGVSDRGAMLFARNPGGAPANVLAMNSKLGGRSAFIGKVGNDAFGAFLESVLREHSVDTTGLVRDAEIPTTLAFVQLDESGDRSFSFYRKPGADVRLEWSEVPKVVIDHGKIFHFGAVSLTDEPCRSATMEAAAYAKWQGKLISFDPNYRAPLWKSEGDAKQHILAAVALADVLKVSHEEMELLTEEHDPEIGSQMLMALGPKAVFVTMGEQGAFYRNGVCCGACPAYPVEAVDTTGAGDAFTGAMLWQIKDMTPAQLACVQLRELVAFSNAAGSLTTTRMGAIPALPTYEEIIHCL